MEIEEVVRLVRALDSNEQQAAHCPWRVNSAYLIRTVTMILVGKVREVHAQELVLDGAAWVADTGRFMSCLRDGTVNEVEPMGDGIIVGRGSIVDAAPWHHDLLREQI